MSSRALAGRNDFSDAWGYAYLGNLNVAGYPANLKGAPNGVASADANVEEDADEL